MIQASSLARGHRKGHLAGFTLIELLVVIAIIGILSAVILAALNTARAKGTDASIKSDLNTVETQAALDYDGNGNSYGTATVFTAVTTTTVFDGTAAAGTSGVGPFGTTAATGDQTSATALNQAISQGKEIWYGVGASGASYFVVSQLTAASGTYWCVDSTGDAKAESAAPTATVYDANYACP